MKRTLTLVLLALCAVLVTGDYTLEASARACPVRRFALDASAKLVEGLSRAVRATIHGSEDVHAKE